MYRLLLTILLCLKATSSAPQTKESDITYVKINPVVEDTPVEAASSIRESRIEKLPLTIPGNVSKSDTKKPDKNPIENPEKNRRESDLSENNSDLSENNSVSSENKSVPSENKSNLSENKSDLPENKSVTSENKSDLSETLDLSESNQSDVLSDASDTEGSNTTDDLSEISPTDDLTESGTDNFSDIVPSETVQSDRRARNFDSVETTETGEDATVKYADGLIDTFRTRTSPKFLPKVPNSNYFLKPRVFQPYAPNHLEIASKRNFISKCSCQKIWNCPKLQITIPRCPDEYFLCCL